MTLDTTKIDFSNDPLFQEARAWKNKSDRLQEIIIKLQQESNRLQSENEHGIHTAQITEIDNNIKMLIEEMEYCNLDRIKKE